MAIASPSKPLRLSGSAGSGDGNYFKESREPIYSALLVLPFLLIYEIGVALLRSDVVNGGDAIVMRLAAPIIPYLGVSGSLVSVLVIVAAFVVWQVWRGGKWRVKPPVLIMMFFESFCFAILLFFVLGVFAHYVSGSSETINPTRDAAVQHQTARIESPAQTRRPVPCAAHRPGSTDSMLRDFILYCGAGVFEELVFRAMLLGLLMLVLTRMLHMEHAYAAAWSVFIGAFIFSAFHHLGEAGDKFEINVFLQRLIAGLYFSALFYTRSFGIAAASHAMYDILVGLNRI